jgi:hypothetical protein
MSKKKLDQLELELLGRSANSNLAQSTIKSNVVDVRQYKIKVHTDRVLGKLRSEGLVKPKSDN